MNTLCLHLIKSILQLINTNIKTIKHDFQFHVVPFDLFSCQFVGYMFFSIVNALYWSCFLHAAYRFTRVLYPKCLWLHRLSTYIYILIPGQVFIAFAGMAPLLWIFKSIDLISGEIYCSLLMEELISLIYFFSMLFCLPFGLIVMCYIYLIYKIRCLKWIRSVTQRNRRDYIVIRRILTILCVLSITSLPTVINLMFFNPNSKIDPFIYRLQWFSSSMNSLIFIISLPFVNPALYQLLKTPQKLQEQNVQLITIQSIRFSKKRNVSVNITCRITAV